jgi:hypothetical protein
MTRNPVGQTHPAPGLAPVSGLVSTKAARYAFWALRPIARALRRPER